MRKRQAPVPKCKRDPRNFHWRQVCHKESLRCESVYVAAADWVRKWEAASAFLTESVSVVSDHVKIERPLESMGYVIEETATETVLACL